MQLLATAAERTMTFEAAEVPMLCPPLPWTSPHSGAFLLSPTKLMRSMEGTVQHQRLLEGCPPAELHGALDALTQLGNCAWRVNGRVLDLVLTLFTDKGCPRLGVPAPPSEAPRPPADRLPADASPEQKAQLRRELAHCLKVAREMHSLRSDALYRLSLAQHLRHRVFWLPHNMDFRGRTYPCPPHFNHLGSDLARALLEFAEGRPLGPHGLDWLKIHLVNLTGLKKRDSLQARLAFAEEVMADVLDSADRPLTVGAGPFALCLRLLSPQSEFGDCSGPLQVSLSPGQRQPRPPESFLSDQLLFLPAFSSAPSCPTPARGRLLRAGQTSLPSVALLSTPSPCPHVTWAGPVPTCARGFLSHSDPSRLGTRPSLAQHTHPPPGPEVVDGGRRALAGPGLLHGDRSGRARPRPRRPHLPLPRSPGELGALQWGPCSAGHWVFGWCARVGASPSGTSWPCHVTHVPPCGESQCPQPRGPGRRCCEQGAEEAWSHGSWPGMPPAALPKALSPLPPRTAPAMACSTMPPWAGTAWGLLPSTWCPRTCRRTCTVGWPHRWVPQTLNLFPASEPIWCLSCEHLGNADPTAVTSAVTGGVTGQ